MVIRSVTHRGLRRLIEENDRQGIRPDLVARVRNTLAALIVAENGDELGGASERVLTLQMTSFTSMDPIRG